MKIKMARNSKNDPKNTEAAMKKIQQEVAEQQRQLERVSAAMAQGRQRAKRGNKQDQRKRVIEQRREQQVKRQKVYAQRQAQIAKAVQGAKNSSELVNLQKKLAAAKKNYQVVKNAHLKNRNAGTRAKRVEALQEYRQLYSIFKEKRNNFLQQNTAKPASITSASKKNPSNEQKTSSPSANKTVKSTKSEDKRLRSLDSRISAAKESLAKADQLQQVAKRGYIDHIKITGKSNDTLFKAMNKTHDSYLQGYKALQSLLREKDNLKLERPASTSPGSTREYREVMKSNREPAENNRPENTTGPKNNM